MENIFFRLYCLQYQSNCEVFCLKIFFIKEFARSCYHIVVWNNQLLLFEPRRTACTSLTKALYHFTAWVWKMIGAVLKIMAPHAVPTLFWQLRVTLIIVLYNYWVFDCSLRSSNVSLNLVPFYQMFRQLKQQGQGFWTSLWIILLIHMLLKCRIMTLITWCNNHHKKI